MNKIMMVIVIGLLVVFIFCAFVQASAQAKLTDHLTSIEEILEANPLVGPQKIQTIKVSERTVTLLITRVAEEVDVQHYSDLVDGQILYVVKGTGQIIVSERWVSSKKRLDIKAGNIYFTTTTKVLAIKNTGSGELIIISFLPTPAKLRIQPINNNQK